VDDQVLATPRHRAAYTLERGVWSATCRVCGFTAKDVNRSSAATWFLTHIRAVRLQARADEALRAAKSWKGDVIDARGLAGRAASKTTPAQTPEVGLHATAADGGH
jgi:hypothetical protein